MIKLKLYVGNALNMNRIHKAICAFKGYNSYPCGYDANICHECGIYCCGYHAYYTDIKVNEIICVQCHRRHKHNE